METNNIYDLKDTMRFCSDIGMFALDRSIPVSCVHKTTVCEKECFNDKLYKVYPAMHGKDIKNEIAWHRNDFIGLSQSLARKKKQTRRARFMTRGEAFSDFNDINRVLNIVNSTPQTIWWIPTRAWRNALLFAAVLNAFKAVKNVRILASMDNSNTPEEWRQIADLGVSTMAFNDDKNPEKTPIGEKVFKCPKTHKHLNGHCEICKGGCFNNKKRVNVHLLKH